MVNLEALDAWKQELRTRYIDVTQIEDEQYIRIKIGRFERFAVSKKTSLVYGISKQNIKKKECFGDIRDWEVWEWIWYPYLKSYDDWRKLEKRDNVCVGREGDRKKAPRTRIVSINKEYKNCSWPYTKGTSEPSGSSGDHSQAMGTQRDALSTGNQKDAIRESSDDSGKKGGRKKIRTK
jgi:hypothetical protein